MEIESNDLVFWPGQAEFLQSTEDEVALITGAGYGKSHVLGYKAVDIVLRNQGWHHGHTGADVNHLRIALGAPDKKFLDKRSIPAVREAISVIEQKSGKRLTARTGRGKDGFFGGHHPRIEFTSAIDLDCYPLVDESSAVAVDLAAFLVDEVTMLKNRNILHRIRNRVRDERRSLFMQKAFVGTPETSHWFYDEFYDEFGEVKPRKHVINASSLENPFLPDSWFEAMKEAGETYVRQQVLGEWVRGVSGERFADVFDVKTHCIPMNINPKNRRYRFMIGIDPGYRTGSWLVLWHNQAQGEFWVVDEIVIKNKTTEQAAKELALKGYGRHNVSLIGCDADASKNRSGVREIDTIKKILGRTPRYRGGHFNLNKKSRIREDYIHKLLSEERIKINSRLIPRSSKTHCLVNSFKYYSNRVFKSEEGEYVDKPSLETVQKWKHPIDALHYVLIWADRKGYKPIQMASMLSSTRDPEERRSIMGLD
tara:strand:- start:5525 stop:6967 length:1443 start_codon:yes stop_codon:yes gene_type:complete